MSLSRILMSAIAMAVVLSLGVTTVESAIPNPTNKRFYACFSKKTGAVRLINYPKVSSCKKGERLRQLERQGSDRRRRVSRERKDPRETQGPAGPADWNAIPNIPAGFADGVDDAGVTGLKVTQYSRSSTIAANISQGITSPNCPPGSRVVGGGHATYSGGVFPYLSIPSGNYWFAAFDNTTNYAATIEAYVICLSTEPAGNITIAKKSKLPAKVKKAIKKLGR